VTAPSKNQAGLKLRLTSTAESIIRQGHHWIFDQSIRSSSRQGKTGELAVIYDRNNRFLAVGLYDAESPIRVRVLHAGKPQPIDSAWWETRLQEALDRRAGLFDDKTNGLRWINGESDGWPALVLDQYAGTLVLKIYSAAWFTHLSTLLPLLQNRLQPERIILRLSRNIQGWASKNSPLHDGSILYGPPAPKPVIFSESGILFLADVVHGQKTGFFLDQRDNRRRVERLADGRSVLNLFSFSGGFSLYAARGGARSVISVDISTHALDELKENWELNSSLPAFQSCTHLEVQADVFEWLKSDREKYDLIIIDPPSLAKKESDRSAAIQAYEKLAAAGLARLEAGGVLVCASCSAHVTQEEFIGAVRKAARLSGKTLRELQITGHAQDHPVKFDELSYLKAIFLQDAG